MGKGNFIKKYGRAIDYIVIHATGGSQDSTVTEIRNYWRSALGWKYPGYHKLIDKFGNVNVLATPDKMTNGVRGYNKNSYHISWIGGHTDDGDNRTKAQKESLYREIKLAIDEFGPNVDVVGHRDLSPDANKDGIISSEEWIKMCPSFDLVTWMNNTGLYNYLLTKK